MDGIWEKLRLEAHAVPLRVNGSTFTILFFDKIARVELHARKIGIVRPEQSSESSATFSSTPDFLSSA